MNAAVGLAGRSAEIVDDTRPSVQDLFATHVVFVWRALRRFGVRQEDLEDQTQEVFMVAHRRFASWDGEFARAWLYAIARRCASGYRRRDHRRHELSVGEPPEPTSASDPGARMDLHRLDQVLQTIDEAKRTVFILFEIEEVPMREVAEIVGCPVQTAYGRLHAARQELARALSEEA